MPTFQSFAIEQYLNDNTKVIKAYQQGKSPFGFKYLKKEVLKRANLLFAHFDNHDARRHLSKMTHDSTAKQKEAIQKSKKASMTQAVKIARELITDLGHHWTLTARKYCRGLQQNETWEAFKKFKQDAEFAHLANLQAQWQPHIKYAMYQADDFIAAFKVLKELEAYYELALSEMMQREHKLSSELATAYHHYLCDLRVALDEEKRQIGLAILALLKNLKQQGDLTVDKHIETEVYPLLRKFYQVPTLWDEQLKATVTPKAFKQLLGFILKGQDPDVKQQLMALNLFDGSHPMPFKAGLFTYQGTAVCAPLGVKHLLESYDAKPWYLKLFDWGVDYLVGFFNPANCFELYEINKTLSILQYEMAQLNGDNCEAKKQLITQIQSLEVTLQKFVSRLDNLLPSRFSAWLKPSLTQFISQFDTQVKAQQVILQQYRLQFCESLAAQAKARRDNHKSLWEPSELLQFKAFFKETQFQLGLTSQNDVKRFSVARQLFVEATDYLHHFLDATLTPDIFPKEVTTIDGVTKERIQAGALTDAIDQFKAHLTEEQVYALNMIKDILTETTYPDLESFDNALECLFKHDVDNRLARNQYIKSLIKIHVLPPNNVYQPQVYKLVEQYDPQLVTAWRSGATIGVDEALAFFRTLLLDPTDNAKGRPVGREIVLSPLSDSFLINGVVTFPTLSEVSRCLQALRWQATPARPYKEYLLKLCRQYIDGYNGANAVYQNLIVWLGALLQDENLVKDYAMKRFNYLMTQRAYPAIGSEPLFQATKANKGLQSALQERLGQFLTNENSQWEERVATLFAQLGTSLQCVEYRQSLDRNRLFALNTLLRNRAPLAAIQQFCQSIQSSKEPAFPASQQTTFDALISAPAYTEWSEIYHELIMTFGETSHKQYHAVLWLKAILAKEATYEKIGTLFKVPVSSEEFIALFGTEHDDKLLDAIEAYLTNRQHAYGLVIVNQLLKIGFENSSRATALLEKLRVEQEAELERLENEAFCQEILDDLANQRYSDAASKINFIVESAHQYQNQAEEKQRSKTQRRLAMIQARLKTYVHDLIESNLSEVAAFYAHFLKHLKTDTSTLSYLCDYSATIKSTYELLEQDLTLLGYQGDASFITLTPDVLSVALKGFTDQQKRTMGGQIFWAVTNCPEAHPAKVALLAFRRLLLDKSTQKADDEKLIANYAEQKRDYESKMALAQQKSATFFAPPAIQPVAVETFIKDSLKMLSKKIPANPTAQTVAKAYAIHKMCPKPNSKPFLEKVDVYYQATFNTLLVSLQVTSSLFSDTNRNVLKECRVAIAQIQFLGAFDKPQDKLVFNQLMMDIFKTYLSRWTNREYPADFSIDTCERLLQAVGSEELQVAVKKLICLRLANNTETLSQESEALFQQYFLQSMSDPSEASSVQTSRTWLNHSIFNLPAKGKKGVSQSTDNCFNVSL